MGTFSTKMFALAFIIFNICSGVRIGLPEDHVDVNSCFSRACISDHDWQEIEEKWHTFRDTVSHMNHSTMAETRSAIWRIFQDGKIWDGNDRKSERNLKKLRDMRHQMDHETKEMRAVEIKDTSTRYDHQAIIMMEADITVQKAAHYLYNKHPLVSTLYEYSKKTNTIKVVAGEEHFLGKQSRVQIVGHGQGSSADMRLATKTPVALAEIVRMLPISNSAIGRVSLVGCNIGSEGQSVFLNDGFTGRFLKSLQLDQGIHTEVSSRNALVSITASGRKETGKIAADGIHWFSKDPLSKIVMKLGVYNEIIRIEMPVTEGIASYNQESSGALVKLTDISENSNNAKIYMEKIRAETNEPGVIKVLETGDINEYIKTLTRTNFLRDITFVQEKLIGRNIVQIRENIHTTVDNKMISNSNKVNIRNVEKKIVESKPGWIEYHQFTGKAYLTNALNRQISEVFNFIITIDLNGNLKMDMASPNAKKSFFLDSGIPTNWKYVARLENLDRVIKVENVREITSRADLIHEINMFGAFGIDMRIGRDMHRYYRFGDTVYKMARSNFYITWEGMIASDAKIKPKHFHDGRISEHEIFPLKEWKWVDSRNRYVLPKGYKLETYPDMTKAIVKEYANRNNLNSGNVLDLMSNFVNGEHASIRQKQIHLLEGSTVLAIGLSEPIRNYRTFVINDMMMNINANEPISLKSLIECNPMTRGKSWGKLGDTGLTVNERGYRIEQKMRVYPREINIARTFLLKVAGDDSQNNKYRFLTETEYKKLGEKIKAGELARLTSRITTNEIRHTIADFRPEINEPIVRTKPLSDIRYPSVNELVAFSDISSSKALPIRASVSMVNDYIYVINHVSEVIAQKSRVTGKVFDIIESSIEVKDGHVKLLVREKSNPTKTVEMNIEINEDSLESKRVKQKASKEIQEVKHTKQYLSKSLANVNTFLGVYGIVMGFRGAVQDFEEGKIGKGIINIAQTVHGIYEMSQTAQKAFQKITSRLLTAGLQKIETSLSSISTRIGSGFSRVSRALSSVGRVAQNFPILGTAFGIYNTVQDIRRKTTIGYIDAGLDAAITISALFGPKAMVVTVALTIVRLVIDDFYYAISKEINNLPSDATVLQKIGAVFKGIGEAIVMTIKHFIDFLHLGFISFFESYINIGKQYKKERDLFRKLSDYNNYLKIIKEEGTHEKIINFAAGEASWNGGDIIFQMFDDNTARLRMQIIDENGNEKNLDKFIYLDEDTNDVVLGIGESHDISFKKVSAKIFWLIPVYSRHLIDKVRGERDTLHGTYHGNSKDNTFYTVQNLTEDVNLGYSLSDYYYEIYGEDGDDTFYLGPQKSLVKGGNGRDTYIVPFCGGKTVINNYAIDLKEDVLFMDVDFEQIYVDRRRNDLILRHGHEHDVTILEWFSGFRSGHLTFKVKNGVIFNVTVGVYGRAIIVPVSIVLTGFTDGHEIDISRGVWENVVTVIGSDASDDIVGNKKDNLLNGGKGYNKLYGGAGSDIYLINSVGASEWSIINNYDTKMTVDKVVFEFSYDEITVFKDGVNVKLGTSAWNGPNVLMSNWFTSEYYRHAIFVTKDDIIFKLADDINDPNLRQPIILDASNEQGPALLDASKEGFENVSTIIGSNFDDKIIGSCGNNYLKGGKGRDSVAGGEGRDVYVIRKGDTGDIIDNFANDGKDDLLLIDFLYSHITVNPLNFDLLLTVLNSPIVTIKNWMMGKHWQHIVIKTIDGVTFRLEKSEDNIVHKIPVEVDKSAMVKTQNVNANRKQMRSVEHIIGSNATDTLTGNEGANTIDPGFGGAYMTGLDGQDQYVIKDHYKGPNIINNCARDNVTDNIKIPTFFTDVYTTVNEEDIILKSNSSPSAAVNLQNYVTDPNCRHLVINTIQDGVLFTLPPDLGFQPTAISIDRTNQAHNLIIDLASKDIWNNVLSVLGSEGHSNVIRGNTNNNTITGGILSDTLEGGDGCDVIRGNQGDDFIDGENGNDILVGGAGNDWIDGGMDDDIIYPGPDADHVNGGPGFDVICVFGDALSKSGVFIDLLSGYGYNGDANGDIYISVEGVIGSFYNDILVGNHYENFLDGYEGNDILFPLDGQDILIGGNGNDIYDISDSKGEKIIRNYADDNEMDFVNLKVYERDRISLEKRSDDLVVHIGILFNDVFCSSLGIGPFYVEQWFKHASNQHLTLQLAHGDLILDNFETGSFTVVHDRIDTEDRVKICDEMFSKMNSSDYYYDTMDYSDNYK